MHEHLGQQKRSPLRVGYNNDKVARRLQASLVILLLLFLCCACLPVLAQHGVVAISHQFNSSNDGMNPYRPVIVGSDGNLYGTTNSGGRGGNGTVFQMTPSGTETILHSFGDGSVANDGSHPYATVCQYTDGSLYGTTTDGGSAGFGTVYKVTTAGVVTILHSFGDGTVVGDAKNPDSSLVLGSDGNF